MPAVFEGLDLVVWVAGLVALVLAIEAKRLLEPIFHALEGPLGKIPFVGDWIRGAMNKAIEALNETIVALRSGVAALWNANLFVLRETMGALEFFGGKVEDTVVELTTHAIPGAFANLWADVQSIVGDLRTELHGLEQDVAADVRNLRKYADNAAGDALSSAESYADSAIADVHDWTRGKIHDAVAAVESDISDAKAAAIAAAEGYANRLRQAIEAELATDIAGVETDLGNAVHSLQSSISSTASALEAELGSAEHTIETTLATDVSSLEQTIAAGEATLAAAIAAAQSTLNAELGNLAGTLEGDIAAVRSEVGAIEHELANAGAIAAGELEKVAGLGYDGIRSLADLEDLSSIVGWGAAIFLVRALVESLAAEAGLGRAECRAKVKGICGVDPFRWANLLAGLAAIGLAFDFRELVKVAESIAEPAAAIVREAAGG